MTSRTALFGVAYAEETGPVGPYIPAVGYPTSAADLYRVAAIVETGHEGWNSCYSDISTCNGLARVVEGEVRSLEDLQAAETALQVLMWHDRVDILVPAFKFRMGEGSAYARSEESRSQLAVDLFRPCQPYDNIFAVERVRVESDSIVDSTFTDSAVRGHTLGEARVEYLKRTPLQASAFAALPIHMGVPAYFSDPLVTAFTGKRGFAGTFYSTLVAQWEEAQAAVPDVDEAVALPPLLAIVLTRASSRDEIPKAVLELRAQLEGVRREMLGLNDLVQGARTQKEIEAKCKDVKASFAAAFRASRHPPVSFLLPLLKLYKATRSPLDALIKILNPSYSPEDPRLVANRTVTGRMFAKLLATDSMHSLATHFFTQAEIRNLEMSRSQARNT